MESSRKVHKCGYCDAVFVHRQSKFKHSLMCQKQPNPIGKFTCDKCLKEFSRKDVLLKHKIRSCKKKQLVSKECDSCEKVFDRQK